jgi:hypothetical protein
MPEAPLARSSNTDSSNSAAKPSTNPLRRHSRRR